MYAAGSESAWEIVELERPDWRIAAQVIASARVSEVLDVGCFDGAFLDLLPRGIARLGVEINDRAVERARGRGVEIVARDLHDLVRTPRRVSCVVAFDVIEHVPDPAAFLSLLGTVLEPGGRIIVATGDFTARTRRYMGSMSLYTWYPEHIAFVSPTWMMEQAAQRGYEVEAIERFSHHPQGLGGFIKGLAKNTLYRSAPRMTARLRGSGPGAGAPPAWASARDHFVAVLRAPEKTDAQRR